jgi:hypothetical protein
VVAAREDLEIAHHVRQVLGGGAGVGVGAGNEVGYPNPDSTT